MTSDGTNWISSADNIPGVGTQTYSRVTGSNVTTTGQSLVDITGLTSALDANAVYEFEANILGSTNGSGNSAGTKYGVQYSAAGAAVYANCISANNSTTAANGSITAFNTATIICLAGAQNVSAGVFFKGIITTGSNAGNLTIQHLKITSGTSTVLIGSYLKVTRIS
jgi:hypothetical protein